MLRARDVSTRLVAPLFGLLLLPACPGEPEPPNGHDVTSERNALPKLDTAAAAKAVAAVKSGPEEAWGPLAAAALSELERERLGDSFVAGLQALTNAAPEQRMVLVAESMSKNISMLDAACAANASETMSTLAVMDVASRDAALWAECKFERLGLVSKTDGMASDPTAVVLAHMAFATVQAAGPVDANERALLEMLATMKKAEAQ